MASAPREDNRVTGLVARSNVDHATAVIIEADPTTHGIVVSATFSGASFGAAIPATGTAAGFSDGVNLQMGKVFDLDSGAGTDYNQGVSLRVSANGGSIEAKAQQAMASSIPVVIASDQTSFPVTIAAGAAVIGHVIVDSGTITTVSAVTAITNALPSGSNVIGHVIVDSGTITTVSAVTAITNALPSGSNVIGHVIVDSGTVTTVSTVTAVTTLTNLGAGNAAATIAADTVTPTVPGIASYNFIKTPGANTWDRSYSVVNATNSTGTGISAVGLLAQFDDVTPTAITENQFGNVRMSTNRNIYVNIRDNAGNERGLNIDASGQLAITLASAQTLGTVTTVSTVTNLVQMNGVAISLNTGAVDTGTQRIVQANNAGKTLASKGGSAAGSGDNTLVAAGTNKLKVYAFSLSTLSTTAVTCIFQSGASGTELWRVVLQAPTGPVNVGANLALTPPAYLFATASATLLNLNLSSANAVHWSVAYFDEA